MPSLLDKSRLGWGGRTFDRAAAPVKVFDASRMSHGWDHQDTFPFASAASAASGTLSEVQSWVHPDHPGPGNSFLNKSSR